MTTHKFRVMNASRSIVEIIDAHSHDDAVKKVTKMHGIQHDRRYTWISDVIEMNTLASKHD